MTNRVLLTVSGEIPADLDDRVRDGTRPRADYVEMARAMGAELLDTGRARADSGRVGRLVRRIGGDHLLLAWECYRRRSEFDAIVTDGEQVGIPLAALLRLSRRRPRHVMIVHILSVRKKTIPFRVLRLGARVDRAIVYATSQLRFLVDELGYPEHRVELTPFMVDTEFFRPGETDASGGPDVCSAGLEYRDYPTLVEAVRGTGINVFLAAASPWSRRVDSSSGLDIPDNVTVGRLDFAALRELYASAEIVAVPVVETDFQAGITTILEAMSMGAALVCTRTTGQTDTIVDGETGVYVPPSDPAALREAIERLLGSPAERERLGANARAWAVEHADVLVYAGTIARVVEQALEEPA